MQYKFIIQGRMPDLNDYLKACNQHYQKGATMKRENMEIAMWEIRKQLKRLHIEKQVNIHYMFVEPNIKRDKDNIAAFGHKVIQDALVKTEVLGNDGWKHILGFTDSFSVDKENPHIEVTIVEVGG